MQCSQGKPHEIHREGSEPCFSPHFSPNSEGAARSAVPGEPCPRARFPSLSRRGHSIGATASGWGLLRPACAGPPGVDACPEICSRCVPRRRMPTCFEARAPRLIPSQSPDLARSASAVGAGMCVWESRGGEPGREGNLPRRALPAGRRAEAHRLPEVLLSGLILGQAAMSHPLCGSHGQRDQNKVSVF